MQKVRSDIKKVKDLSAQAKEALDAQKQKTTEELETCEDHLHEQEQLLSMKDKECKEYEENLRNRLFDRLKQVQDARHFKGDDWRLQLQGMKASLNILQFTSVESYKERLKREWKRRSQKYQRFVVANERCRLEIQQVREKYNNSAKILKEHLRRFLEEIGYPEKTSAKTLRTVSDNILSQCSHALGSYGVNFLEDLDPELCYEASRIIPEVPENFDDVIKQIIFPPKLKEEHPMSPVLRASILHLSDKASGTNERNGLEMIDKQQDPSYMRKTKTFKLYEKVQRPEDDDDHPNISQFCHSSERYGPWVGAGTGQSKHVASAKDSKVRQHTLNNLSPESSGKCSGGVGGAKTPEDSSNVRTSPIKKSSEVPQEKEDKHASSQRRGSYFGLYSGDGNRSASAMDQSREDPELAQLDGRSRSQLRAWKLRNHEHSASDDGRRGSRDTTSTGNLRTVSHKRLSMLAQPKICSFEDEEQAIPRDARVFQDDNIRTQYKRLSLRDNNSPVLRNHSRAYNQDENDANRRLVRTSSKKIEELSRPKRSPDKQGSPSDHDYELVRTKSSKWFYQLRSSSNGEKNPENANSYTSTSEGTWNELFSARPPSVPNLSRALSRKELSQRNSFHSSSSSQVNLPVVTDEDIDAIVDSSEDDSDGASERRRSKRSSKKGRKPRSNNRLMQTTAASRNRYTLSRPKSFLEQLQEGCIPEELYEYVDSSQGDQ